MIRSFAHSIKSRYHNCVHSLIVFYFRIWLFNEYTCSIFKLLKPRTILDSIQYLSKCNIPCTYVWGTNKQVRHKLLNLKLCSSIAIYYIWAYFTFVHRLRLNFGMFIWIQSSTQTLLINMGQNPWCFTRASGILFWFFGFFFLSIYFFITNF